MTTVLKHHFKTALKIAASFAIVLIVLRNIDEKTLWKALRESNPGWLVWTALWFIGSKIMAAYRLNDLLKTEDIHLTGPTPLRFYWLGMYYNLLLPGGISGDGYKIKILMDAYNKPFKPLFYITLFDRLSGVVALGQLCLFLCLFEPHLRHFWVLWATGLLLSVPVSYFIFKKMLAKSRSVWNKTTLQGMAVQGAQLVATLGLLFASGQQNDWIGYSILFLVSSVAAMLPFTIGGTGARELTFLWGAAFLQVEPEKAVAIAFLFYIISTAVAFWGILYSFNFLLKKS